MKNLTLLNGLFLILLNVIYSQTVTFTIESNFNDNYVYKSFSNLIIRLESTFNDDYVYNSGNSNNAEIEDLINDLRGAKFSWYGKFETGSTAMYTNNVNTLFFDKASGVDTAYLDISGSDGYDGRYPIDEYGELDLLSQGGSGQIQIKRHNITLGGIELNIETPKFYFPSNNIFNSTLSTAIAGYTYQLQEDWSIEFSAGQFPGGSTYDVSTNGPSSGSLSDNAEIEDLINDLRGAKFSWYGKFETGSTAMYTNNVNTLFFDKASGVDTAYLDISGSDGYDGRYPIDEYGELDLLSQGGSGQIQIKRHNITLGGIELNIETPKFYFPSNNIFNSNLSPAIAGYTYRLEEDWGIEFSAGQYPSVSTYDVSTNGSGGIGDIIADSDGDNVRDSIDTFDNDPTETTDSDSDGVGDNSDAFPNDTNETVTLTKLSENGYYTLSEIQNIRAGSTMIEVENGQATLSMEVEESDDLGIWTTGGASTLQIPIDAQAGKKFFRFKMTE